MSIATEIARRNDKLERFIARIGTSQDDAKLRSALEKTLNETNGRVHNILRSEAAVRRESKAGHWPALEKQIRRFDQLNKRACALYAKPRFRHWSCTYSQSQQGKPLRSGDGAVKRQIRRTRTRFGKRLPTTIVDEVVEFDLTDLQTRHDRLVEIERDVESVHELFTNVLTVVQEQGHTLDVIDSHIEKTLGNTSEAQRELVQAERYQNQVRNSKCCIGTIVLIVIAVIVIILATK